MVAQGVPWSLGFYGVVSLDQTSLDLLMALFFLVAARWGHDFHPAVSMVDSSGL